MQVISCYQIKGRVMAAEKSRSNNLTLDRYGMALSIGCAVHCALVPVGMSLLTASSLSSMSWVTGNELEWAILACTLIVASWRLVKSFAEHRNPTSLYLFMAGLVFFAAAKMAWFRFPYNEAWLMTAGGLTVAAAHFRNLRICSCCHSHPH